MNYHVPETLHQPISPQSHPFRISKENFIVRAIKYRELKQMYSSHGPEQTVAALREAIRDGELTAEDFSLRDLAEATVGHEWVQRMDPRSAAASAAGSRRRRRRDGLFQHRRSDHLLKDPGGVHAGGVRRLEAGRDDPYPLRRRKDSRHRPRRRRGGRGPAGHALSQPGVWRGLHRDALDHQARIHRAGDARSDLLRPHASDPTAGGRSGRGARIAQGKAAVGPDARHAQQL